MPELSDSVKTSNRHHDRLENPFDWLAPSEQMPGMTEQKAAARYLEIISVFDQRLDALAAALEQTEIRSDRHMTDLDAVIENQPLVLVVQKLASAWTLRAEARFRAGDMDGGWQDLQSVLLLHEKYPSDNLLSVLVSSAVGDVGANLLWVCLKNDCLSDSELAEVKNRFLAMPTVHSDFHQALFGARADILSAFRVMGQNSNALEALGVPAVDWTDLTNYSDWEYFTKFLKLVKFHHGPHGKHLLAGVRLSNHLDEYLFKPLAANGGRFTPTIVEKIRADFAGQDPHGIYPHITYYASFAESALLKAITRRLLILALATEEFHRKNGTYPTALPDLVPEFLAEIPNDPFSEPQQNLRYKLSPEGKPIFWSVGKNGTDEGGLQTGYRPAESEDIVWK